MTTKEFLINIALLALILLFGWLTFNLEEPVHEPADIDALIVRTPAEETPAPTPDETETSYQGAGPTRPTPTPSSAAGARADAVRARYPEYAAHNVFETLIPTPSPTPTPIAVPPPIPPLKEALRGRWTFSYAMNAMGQAQWTDNTTQQQFVIKLGETYQFQYGKFNYRVQLDLINDDEFAAHLRTVHVSVDDFQITEDELRVEDQKVVYSLFHQELNP